jgi:hypothetical protein
MGPICCPETSVNNDHTTPCNNPEDRRFNQKPQDRRPYRAPKIATLVDEVGTVDTANIDWAILLYNHLH